MKFVTTFHLSLWTSSRRCHFCCCFFFFSLFFFATSNFINNNLNVCLSSPLLLTLFRHLKLYKHLFSILSGGLKENEQYFKHLIGIPKPLLPLGNKLLLDYHIETLERHKSMSLIGDIYIVTNQAKFEYFKNWAFQNRFIISRSS